MHCKNGNIKWVVIFLLITVISVILDPGVHMAYNTKCTFITTTSIINKERLIEILLLLQTMRIVEKIGTIWQFNLYSHCKEKRDWRLTSPPEIKPCKASFKPCYLVNANFVS